jgi:transcriptional regulator with XRE-family HTH domain
VGIKNIVGLQIQKARKKSNPIITQLDLIARLEVQGIFLSQSALSKIEHGSRPVSDLEVKAFAEALKVSIAWLYYEET